MSYSQHIIVLVALLTFFKHIEYVYDAYLV